MKKQPFVPSPEQLAGAPRLFLYELRMLRDTTKLRLTDYERDQPATRVLRRALTESALIHARNLLDFFVHEPDPRLRDDILAAHFVRTPQDGSWEPSGLTYLKSSHTSINGALSHLAYARVDGRLDWDFKRIRDEIEQAYGELLDALPASERVKWQA